MILAPLSRIFLVKLNGFFPESCRLKIKDDKPDTMKLLDYQAFLPGVSNFIKFSSPRWTSGKLAILNPAPRLGCPWPLFTIGKIFDAAG
jgi:hypothetical protein